MTIDRLLAGYRDGSLDPVAVVGRAHAAARDASQPSWISLLPWEEVRRRLDALAAGPIDLPLYGIPFGIKDNIDLAGLPTTAGCPAFATVATESATVVRRLEAAGAIPLGKTNMDQFATGLVGTRSPYGACASVADARYVSGGSSSGSAVVVADGTVPFALGTDTAGSGRVPAAFNGIVGVKPSLGLISTRGTVPACRSLDCVSVFTTTVADAERVLEVAAGVDPDDPFSRPRPATERPVRDVPRVGLPRAGQLRFFGDLDAEAAWRAATEQAHERGWELVEVDLDPFTEAAALLYEGPWLAERYVAVGDFIHEHLADADPVVADVILSGRGATAADAFRALHRLAELRHVSGRAFAELDALLLPTAPTIYTHAEVAEAPILRNSVLGTYTNFVNLLDLCAIAVPGPVRPDGLPFGVTLVAPWGADAALGALAARWTGAPVDVPAPTSAPPPEALVAVVGAHLTGEPLNHQLTELGAALAETTRTAPTYRLFALPDTEPAKPGLVGGHPPQGDGVEVELWRIAPADLGRLLVQVPAPLAIGTVVLADGRAVLGFLCEAAATAGARDITAHGGWRAWRAAEGGAVAR